MILLDEDRKELLEKIRDYAKTHKHEIPANKVPVSGKVFDEEEIVNATDAILEGWWTEGKYCAEFERSIASYIGLPFATTVNSGSSANLVAFYSLTSHKLGEKRIKKGDEVITAAAGFPTTINPIILFGAVPVFLDVELGTYNVSASDVEAAITKKTKAIFLAHTLGNPFGVEKLRKVADENDVWLIEDSCDALGSEYNGKKTGSFGHIATYSFYPAHQITTAEGGAVLTKNPMLNKIIRSMRDWGRDCWCHTGQENTCQKRFSWKLGGLPKGYDHKYIYSEIGFNLKMTDIQAAIGFAQIKKLPKFVEKRRENFNYLKNRFIEEGLDQIFVLPHAEAKANPSWFGFPLTIKNGINREKLLEDLNKHGISTRLLFAGNIIKQPYFTNNKIDYRIFDRLENSDTVMEKTFWIGVYPALEKENLEYSVKTIKKLVFGNDR